MEEKPLSQLIRHSKWYFVLAIVLAIIGAALTLVPYLIAARIIMQLFTHAVTLAQFWGDFVWLVMSNVLAKGCHAASTYYSHLGTFQVLCELRTRSIKRISQAPLGVVQERHVGSYQNLLVAVIEQLSLCSHTWYRI